MPVHYPRTSNPIKAPAVAPLLTVVEVRDRASLRVESRYEIGGEVRALESRYEIETVSLLML